MLVFQLFWLLLIISKWSFFVSTQQYACEELIWETGYSKITINVMEYGFELVDFDNCEFISYYYIGINGTIYISDNTTTIMSNFDYFSLGKEKSENKMIKYNQYLYFADGTPIIDEDTIFYFDDLSTFNCIKFKVVHDTQSQNICSSYEFTAKSYLFNTMEWFNISGALVLTSTETIINVTTFSDSGLNTSMFLFENEYKLHANFTHIFINPVSGYVPVIVDSEYGQFTIGDFFYEDHLIVEIAGQDSLKPIISFERKNGNIFTMYNYVCKDPVLFQNIVLTPLSISLSSW